MNFSDPFGLCSVLSAAANVAMGAAISYATKSSYGLSAAAMDVASGCVGIGTLTKAGKLASLVRNGVRGRKAIHLPSVRKIKIGMGHVRDRHMIGGVEVTAEKTLFPYNMSEAGIERAIKQAYGTASTVRTQGDRILLRGTSDSGLEIEMWLNRATKEIETAYPVISGRP